MGTAQRKVRCVNLQIPKRRVPTPSGYREREQARKGPERISQALAAEDLFRETDPRFPGFQEAAASNLELRLITRLTGLITGLALAILS